ncbi:MAG: hypothetical protein JW797_02480 [Bradymonadales bacterium]|nr:hypothetical protein [Bradymonadales bacterium]
MVRTFLMLTLAWLTLAFTLSCSDEDDGQRDAGRDVEIDRPVDQVVDLPVPDLLPDDDLGPDDAVTPDSVDCQVSDWDPDGAIEPFTIRVPQERTVMCTYPEEDPQETAFYDQDLLCRFEYECTWFDLYLQATPTGCVSTGFPYPSFDEPGAVSAWIRVAGQISPIEATYDYGGNHHNEWLTFTLDDQRFRIAHSSIGCGGRACAPPDCLQLCASTGPCEANADVVVNGCARETGSGPPPLPVICVTINADGSVPPLLDPWVSHPEDEYYPLLPCACDFVDI